MNTSQPIAALGAFDLYEPLGRGGMGVVYRGTHRGLGLPVAVKLVVAAQSRAARFRASFRNEVRLSARLDHPHIVGVLDYGESDVVVGPHPVGTPWLVMEQVGGGILSKHLGQLPWPEVKQILLQLLDALAHAHARGVMHRDLKPGNVLLDAYGHPKLTDFGLAHALDARQRTKIGSRKVVAGTPAYMAPEQFRGATQSYGPWTDLYSFGCLAWALVTGSSPFPKTRSVAARSTQHQFTEPPPLSSTIAIPAAFEDWLRCLLEKDAGSRFQRAADASWALQQMGEADRPASAPRSAVQAAFDQSLATLSWTVLTTLSADEPFIEEDPETDTTTLGYGLARPRWAPPPLADTWRRARPRTSIQLRDAGLGLFGLRTVPLVDRAQPRDLLWDALFATYNDREPRAVVLSGAAGVGKTRLAHWLKSRSHEAGAAHVFDARHAELPGSADGVGPMFARFMRTADLAPDAAEARLGRILRSFGIHDPREPATMRACLAADSATTVAKDTDRFGAWHRLLLHIAGHTLGTERRRAIVLVLDDVQWAAAAIRFTRHLLQVAEPPVAVLVLLTVTPELLTDRPVEAALLQTLLDEPRAQQIDLAPLEERDHAALVDGLIRLAPPLAQEVVTRTAGNPLFAVQLVGEWIARGDLHATDQGYDLTSAARDLPQDLAGIWTTRVERALAERHDEETHCLELAAVLGAEVDAREWEDICAQAGRTSDEAVRDEFISLRLAQSDDPSEAWRFAHPRIQQTLLHRAEAGGRLQAWHEAAVTALSGRPNGTPERVGRHLLGAGKASESLPFLLDGVERRLALADWGFAATLLELHESALDALDLPDTDPRRGQGWLLRARLALRRDERPTAEALLERILTYIDEPGWAAVIVQGLRFHGRVLRRQGHLREGLAVAEQATERARALTDREALAETLLDLGEVQVELGDREASAASTAEALELCQAREDSAGVARCEEQLGWLAQGAGDYRRARMLYDRAAATWRALGQRWGEAQVRNISGDVSRYSGDLSGADSLYLESERLYASVGAWSKIYPQYNRVLVALERGEFDVAKERLDKVQPIFERLDHRPTLADIAIVRCALAIHAGQTEAWDTQLAKARRLYEETGVTDEDSARVAELAATTAERAGHADRAKGTWDIATAQWTALARTDEVERIAAHLAG